MSRTASRLVTGTVLALGVTLAACGSSSERGGYASDDAPAAPAPSGTNDGTGSLGPRADAGAPTAATGGCEKMDIVFVVDNSGSMGEEQANLAVNFPKFVSVLDQTKASNGAPIDYRVAVTTTGKSYKLIGPFGIGDSEKGDDGAFRNNCGGSKRWLERSEASASFACRAQVGTGGPSEEMPLECMRLALTDRMTDGTNAGFVRNDALLAVVFLTDEDDCSFKGTQLNEGFGDLCESNGAEAPEAYALTLDVIKGDRARWATAVIAGKTTCQSTFGSAAEAKRLGRFVTATGKNAVFSSICEGDLSKGLEEAIAKFGEACRSFPSPR
jgi:hypothetical protein